MCGIAGILNLSEATTIAPSVVRRMADAILHRGPDEDGLLSRPGLAFGNRRLSIVGLHDGKQPVFNEDRSVGVVFNGELFDFREQRVQLQSKGHVFRTSCDTELFPHLWEEHGEQMLDHVKGQFAFALWDERHGVALFARDRFGICPFYWTVQPTPQGELFIFASEIKAILASGLVKAEADPRGIHHAFTFFATPGPVTCFKGIHCLLPGYRLKIKPKWAGGDGKVDERAYFEIDFPDRGDEFLGDYRRLGSNAASRVVEEFGEIFDRAVEKRLRADVPVVSYLSGGIDSSVVVASACAQRRKEGKGPIPTFTISVLDPSLNEKSEASLVARHVGVDPIIVDCGRGEVLDTYPELIRAAEAPVIDTACAALCMLAKSVHQHGYKVALTGEGADEWLAGYPWYKIHKALQAVDVIPGLPISPSLRRLYMRITGAPKFSWSAAKALQEEIGGPNAWMNIYGLFSTAKLRFFSAHLWDQLVDHRPYRDLRLNVSRMKAWHPLNRSLYLGARVMLPGLLLASKGDRVAMNASVETRYPFLDEDVYAYLAKLHPRWKMPGFRDKYILRLMGQTRVPHEIAWRRKAMFRAPLDGFHLSEMPTFVDELLSPESLRKTGYFDETSVLDFRSKFKTMRGNQRTMVEMGLVGVVATQLWHHTYIDSSLCGLPSWTPPTIREESAAPATFAPATTTRAVDHAS